MTTDPKMTSTQELHASARKATDASSLPYSTIGLSVRQRAFLAAYSYPGNITTTAKTAGVSRRSHARWLQASEAYRVAFHQAYEAMVEQSIAEIRERCRGRE